MGLGEGAQLAEKTWQFKQNWRQNTWVSSSVCQGREISSKFSRFFFFLIKKFLSTPLNKMTSFSFLISLDSQINICHSQAFTRRWICLIKSYQMLGQVSVSWSMKTSWSLIFQSRTSCVLAKSLQSCPTLCHPMDCSLPWVSPGGVACHFSPPGDLSDPRIKPTSLMFPALAGGFFVTSTIWEACVCSACELRKL